MWVLVGSAIWPRGTGVHCGGPFLDPAPPRGAHQDPSAPCTQSLRPSRRARLLLSSCTFRRLKKKHFVTSLVRGSIGNATCHRREAASPSPPAARIDIRYEGRAELVVARSAPARAPVLLSPAQHIVSNRSSIVLERERRRERREHQLDARRAGLVRVPTRACAVRTFVSSRRLLWTPSSPVLGLLSPASTDCSCLHGVAGFRPERTLLRCFAAPRADHA